MWEDSPLGVMVKVLDCENLASLNSSYAITFTFRLIPLRKA